MKLVVLGSGTSSGVPIPTCPCDVCRSDDPRDRRTRTSAWLTWGRTSIVIDTSSDFREQALRFDIPSIDAVLYTHAHADHILGLDDLRVYNWHRGGPIPAYASAETCAAVRRTFWYAFEDDGHPSTKPAIDLNAVEGPFELEGKRIVPVPVDHGPQRILGYRIDDMAYLTDVSAVPDASLDLLAGLDALVLSALRERPHPTHMTLEQAIACARRIGAERTWFTHMSHEIAHAATEARLPDGIGLAYDGLVVTSKA